MVNYIPKEDLSTQAESTSRNNSSLNNIDHKMPSKLNKEPTLNDLGLEGPEVGNRDDNNFNKLLATV